MRGGLTGKGGPAGHKERPGTREDRGAGREGVSGAGRALRNPGTGERARPLRERGDGLCLQRSGRRRGGARL